MMNSAKVLLTCCLAPFFLLSCGSEDSTVPENPLQVSYVSIDTDSHLLGIVSNLRESNGMLSSANGTTRDIYADAEWDFVTKLEDKRSEYDRTVYAAFLKNIEDQDVQENLIISQIGGKDRQMIIRYRAEKDWFLNHSLTNDIDKFTGTVEFVTLKGEVFAKSKFRDGVSFIPDRGSSDCDVWITVEYETVVQLLDGGPYDNELVSWTVSEYIPCETGLSDPAQWLQPSGNPTPGGGGGTVVYVGPAFPVSDPNVLKPCPGNPLAGMGIAAQKESGVNGGRFGPNRTYKNGNTKWHKGTDLKTALGAPIYSMFAGTVIQVKTNHSKLGNYVVIRSNVNGRDIYHYYGHLQAPTITVGTIVAGGAQIGNSGSSGNLGEAVLNGTTEQHVHIIVRDTLVSDPNGHPRGAKVDPEKFFSTVFDENGNRMDQQSDCMNTTI